MPSSRRQDSSSVCDINCQIWRRKHDGSGAVFLDPGLATTAFCSVLCSTLWYARSWSGLVLQQDNDPKQKSKLCQNYFRNKDQDGKLENIFSIKNWKNWGVLKLLTGSVYIEYIHIILYIQYIYIYMYTSLSLSLWAGHHFWNIYSQLKVLSRFVQYLTVTDDAQPQSLKSKLILAGILN